jgi:hypothetical protein
MGEQVDGRIIPFQKIGGGWRGEGSQRQMRDADGRALRRVYDPLHKDPAAFERGVIPARPTKSYLKVPAV